MTTPIRAPGALFAGAPLTQHFQADDREAIRRGVKRTAEANAAWLALSPDDRAAIAAAIKEKLGAHTRGIVYEWACWYEALKWRPNVSTPPAPVPAEPTTEVQDEKPAEEMADVIPFRTPERKPSRRSSKRAGGSSK